MDLLTLLFTAGPTVIRAVGSVFGGKTAETANSVAGMVDAVQTLPAAVAKERLAAQVAALPAEAQVALQQIQVQLAKIEQEREAARLAAETAQQAQVQETARVEAQSSDEYVRRTRPKLARDSWLAAMAYAFIAGVVFPLLAQAYGITLPTIQEWIIMALAAPCLSYIGARSVDSFSRSGKT